MDSERAGSLDERKKYSWTKVRSAYYAGVFDCEGSIGLYHLKKAKRGSRWQYVVTLRVAMTSRDTLTGMRAQFGAGTVRSYPFKPPRQRSWVWFCGSRSDVIRLLQEMQPLLEMKAHEAKIALDYLLAERLTDKQQEGLYRAMRLPKVRQRSSGRNKYGSFPIRDITR